MRVQQILVIDNYDSFTYNLVHLVEKIGLQQPKVIRNDEINWESLSAFDKIILSPGPGIPSEAGQLIPLIQHLAETKDILGVCLGHQALAVAFGGRLLNLAEVFHGIATQIEILENPKSKLFNDIPARIEVGRYHSWVVDPNTLPECFRISAKDLDGNIMAIEHKTLKLAGIQFHPESILTPLGEKIMRNWLER